jgi:hypothetical protein
MDTSQTNCSGSVSVNFGTFKLTRWRRKSGHLRERKRSRFIWQLRCCLLDVAGEEEWSFAGEVTRDRSRCRESRSAQVRMMYPRESAGARQPVE